MRIDPYEYQPKHEPPSFREFLINLAIALFSIWITDKIFKH